MYLQPLPRQGAATSQFQGGATLAHPDVAARIPYHSCMDIVHLIQSAVAPVFLLSGVGVTLGVLTNRLARIVDRARSLELRVDEDGARAESTAASLRVLARRAHYINTAIALCTISALFVSLVVMSLFASAFTSINLSGAIAILFVAAMICLTGAFGAFLVEVRIATQALRFGSHH
jgi:hypothetical protein